MIDDVERWACVEGRPAGGLLRKEQVRFEKWW